MTAPRLRDVHVLRVVQAGAVALLASLATGCVIAAQPFKVEGSFDRTLPVSGTVDLSVKTGAGNIQITIGAADAVRVVGHIRAGGGFWNSVDPTEQVRKLEAGPPIEQHDNVIQVGDITDPLLRQNVSISYELVVPPDTRIRSNTGSGNQSVDAIRGPLEAHAGSGNIRVSRIGGHASLSTGSGDIEIGGAEGGLDARTGSGSVHAEGIAGAITAHTGSGDVRIAQTAAGELDAQAGSGSIAVTGTRGPVRVRTGSGNVNVEGAVAADWTLSAASGNVTVQVPADAAFDLDARVASGSFDTSHPIALVGTVSKHRFQGKARGGGARLDVSTGSGAIRID